MSSDDEGVVTAAAIITATAKKRRQLKPRQKRHWWSLSLYRNRTKNGIEAIMRDLYMEKHSGKLENFLRMSDADFTFLLNKIAPIISKQEIYLRKLILAKRRFVATLQFLASGESYQDLSYLSRISSHAIWNIVMDVCKVLIEIFADQIKLQRHGKGREVSCRT